MRTLPLLLALAGCDPAAPWTWDQLPDDVGPPLVPEGEAVTRGRVAVGERLFFDPGLSFDGSTACVDCHLPEQAFTDGRELSPGATGELTKRNSPSLRYAAWLDTFSWANPTLPDLERQILVPLFNEDPVELGWVQHQDDILARVEADHGPALRRAFPDDDVSAGLVARALAAYVRTLGPFDSPWDRARAGDATALSTAARRGEVLFRSEALGCATCHGGPLFSGAAAHALSPEPTHPWAASEVHAGARTAGPSSDLGLEEFTFDPEDRGVFRTPSLRNVAVTGPWLHDGSVETLESIVRDAVNRRNTSADTGGSDSPDAQDDGLTSMSGFARAEQDITDLMAFLDALTDGDLVSDP